MTALSEAVVTTLRLKLACWDYDRTRPLIDGRVQPDGIDLDVSVMRPREAFKRMLDAEEFDVAEVSLASYARLKAEGDKRFVGLPVALSRMFRHSCIYIRADAGITTPEDIRGRRVGAAQLDSTGAIFIKALLTHEYGVRPDEIKWVCGGLEVPQVITAPSRGHGDAITLGPEKTICECFMDGRIDALISNHIPSLFEQRDPRMLRLFPDYKSAEQQYFRRTGIFPIMHVVAIRSDVHRRNPQVAAAIYDAFCRARDLAMRGLYDTDALRLTLPWLIDHIEETRQAFGDRYWEYGIDANSRVWTAFCRYQMEQGITTQCATVDDLFVVA